MKRLLLALALSVAIAGCSPGTERVVVAAGTTLVDSGFLDDVAAVYESNHPGIEVSIVAEPTALALELGRQGAADLLIVHAPALEAEFVAEGHGQENLPLFESTFVLVGPSDLEPTMTGLDAAEVFARVSERGLAFVSRGDGSGTHEKEMELWSALGVDPTEQTWYLQTGSGMGPTLLVADQRRAVTLSELGAYKAALPALELVPFDLDDPGLANPYTGYVASNGANPSGASDFLAWLTSPEGDSVIEQANLSLFGEIVYAPATS